MKKKITTKQLALASLKDSDQFIVLAWNEKETKLRLHKDLGNRGLTLLGGLEIVKEEIFERVKLATKTTNP